jgi:LysM repeat protein
MKIHIVRPGETFFDLVQKYNIPYERLLEANPQITPEKLQVGQKVRVPSGKVWVSQPETGNDQPEQANEEMRVDPADQAQAQPEPKEPAAEEKEKILLPTYMHPIELEVDDLSKNPYETVDFSSSLESVYDSPFVPFFPLEAGNVYPQIQNQPYYPYEPIPYPNPIYPPPTPYFPPQNWDPAWNRMMLGSKVESSSSEY